MPKMYEELASWWPLLSAPADYEEEAAFYGKTLAAACERPPRTLLELFTTAGRAEVSERRDASASSVTRTSRQGKEASSRPAIDAWPNAFVCYVPTA